MLLKGRGEMRNGGITQQHGYFRYTQPFFIKQVFGVFHPLALVKIKYRGAKAFLEPFFQVTLVDRHFPAEFLDGNGFPDMLDQDLPGPHDLFPVCLIGQEFTAHHINFLFPEHAVQAVEQEHLGLGIDIDIFERIGISMVEHSFQHHPGLTTKREDLGKGGTVPECENIIREGGIAFATPEGAAMGGEVAPQSFFKLYEKPDEAWLKWKPAIPLARVATQ